MSVCERKRVKEKKKEKIERKNRQRKRKIKKLKERKKKEQEREKKRRDRKKLRKKEVDGVCEGGEGGSAPVKHLIPVGAVSRARNLLENWLL